MSKLHKLISTIWSPSEAAPAVPSAGTPALAAQSAGADKPSGLFDLLALEGCAPGVDEAGDILFDYQGLHLVLRQDTQDTEFLSIWLPNIGSAGSGDVALAQLQAAHYITHKFKVVKAVVYRGRVHLVAEYLLQDPASLGPTLVRVLDALAAARSAYLTAEDVYRSGGPLAA